MYTVSDELAALITSPCRTWRILLEDLTTARTLTAEAIFTANSDRESTSLSDDIELGAVCSQSWTVNIADSAGGYVGHMFRLSRCLSDPLARFRREFCFACKARNIAYAIPQNVARCGARKRNIIAFHDYRNIIIIFYFVLKSANVLIFGDVLRFAKQIVDVKSTK